MPAERDALAGVGVLVTRPVRQAAALAARLERAGAHALRFPLTVIAPPSDPNEAQSALDSLDRASLVLFTSANAARNAFALLPGFGAKLDRSYVACIGEATARALEECGARAHAVPPEGSSSEALLALDALQETAVRGREVAIIKGEGGRDRLSRTLTERGAEVRLVDVYRRLPPADSLPEFLERDGERIAIAIVTSAEAIERLDALAGERWRPRVHGWPLVLPSERVAARARELGFDGPVELPPRIDDAGLCAAAAALAVRAGVSN